MSLKPSRMGVNRQRKYADSKPPTIYKANFLGIEDFFDEMEAGVEDAIRPAAQAAAEVIYQAVRSNVEALKTHPTGNLLGSIYQAHIPEMSVEGVSETYQISWRTVKNGLPRAPHGHLVEYGHIMKFKRYLDSEGQWHTDKNAPLATPKQVAARPFLRPAINKLPEAQDAALAVLYEALNAQTT